MSNATFFRLKSLFPERTIFSAASGWWRILAVVAVLQVPACTFDTTGLKEVHQNNNNVNNLTCGNDLRETGEVCDGTDLAGQTCITRGFDGGTLACAEGCAAFDISACVGTGPVCGDGVKEGDETCDATDLGGESCSSQGFAAGALLCLSNCSGFDFSACTQCGNNLINIGELCDGTALGAATCLNQGFAGGGSLACNADCQTFNTTGCISASCGNNAIENPEVCDGTALGGQTCVTQGFTGGTLACSAGCTAFDTTGCTQCGNNAIENPEVCDGTALAGQTCVSQGFFGGTLACNGPCTGFVTTGCTNCGNNAINAPEVCDGTALGGQTCVSQGFVTGTLGCNGSCSAFVTTGCTMCGNNAVNAPEVCDGTALAGQTCATQGFAGGNLTCNGACTGFVTTGCTMCGNNIINAPEVCDGTALGGRNCAFYGCRSGALACVADCSAFYPAGCYDNHDEDGDTIDDNCDNCPTVANTPQTDGDGDGLGDACESTVAGLSLSGFPYFHAFVTAPTGFTVFAGTWTPSADLVGGTVAGGGANYLHTDVLSGNYSVESTLNYRNNGPAGAKYSGVAVAAKTDSGGALTSFIVCTYERQAKQIQIWEWTTAGGYTSRGAVNVTTTATNAQWRRVRATVSWLATVTCAITDETGASGSATYIWITGATDFLSGRAGLRLYNDTADFRSYIRYQ